MKITALNITPVTNHREREKGIIVYPVYSRRSAGLSVGINLYPDKKTCRFSCPYCEVFPFSCNAQFSIGQMEDDLYTAIQAAHEQNIPVKDICFSGNGEPTLSPFFTKAVKSSETIRNKAAPNACLVVITNGTGLQHKNIFSFLKETARNSFFDIWLKLDAGTPGWYQKINRCALPFDTHIKIIKEFSSSAVFTVQTMLCAVNGEQPPQEEEHSWEELALELAANKVRKVQLYGKARSSPEDPLAPELPQEYLEKRASSLRSKFKEKGITTPVEVFI